MLLYIYRISCPTYLFYILFSYIQNVLKYDLKIRHVYVPKNRKLDVFEQLYTNHTAGAGVRTGKLQTVAGAAQKMGRLQMFFLIRIRLTDSKFIYWYVKTFNYAY